MVHPVPSAIYSFAVLDTNLFAGTSDGVFRSTDNGTTWTPADHGLLVPYTNYWYIHALAASGTNIFAGTSYGVYRSTDNGSEWTAVGLTDFTPVVSLATIGTNLFAGTNVSGAVYRSTDDGSNWTAVGLTGNLATAFAVSCTHVFAATAGAGVFLSTDSGINWVPVNDGLTEPVVNALAVIGKTLFAGTGGSGVYRSTDNGTLWTAANADMPGSCLVYSLAVSGTDLFAGTSCGVFRSCDNGTNWSQWNTGLTDANVQVLIISGTDILAGTGHGIWRRTVSEVLPIQLASFRATSLNSNGVELTWSTISETNNYGFHVQRNGADIAFIAGHGTTLQQHTYSYTDNPPPGLCQYRLRQVDLDGTATLSESYLIDVTAPAKFALAQNYPNPFNPSTTIRYALPSKSHVTLSVYNNLGQRVADLVRGDMDAGYHDVKFDGTGLASGLYFYRIQAGTYVQTKTLLLVK